MMEQDFEGYRLSPQQMRVWRTQNGCASHLAQCAILIEGSLQLETLRRAVSGIVERHEILRTRFVKSPGIKLPFQVVMDGAQPDWETEDWTALAPAQQIAKIDCLLEEQQRIRPDLERAPLLHFALRRLTERSHVLVITLPSLAADSDTLDILLREIARSYDGCLTAHEPPGEVLQYADYCAWLEETAAAGDDAAVAGIAYWHAQNRTREPVVLPFQYLEKAGDRANVGLVLSDVGVNPQALCDAAAREHVSASDFLLACFQTLIGRLAASRSIVTAVKLPCRAHEELRDAFGVFARWAPIHTELLEGAPFRSVLAGVGAAVRQAERWQDYHLDVIDDEERPEPTYGFDYEDSPQPVHTEAGISFLLIRKHVGEGRFTLRLRCSHAPDSLAAVWDYDSQLLAADDVEQVAEHFRAVVGDAVRACDTTGDRLAVLTPRQREQILVGFNTPSVSSRRTAAPECIHERIREQAQQTPDNVAVVYEDNYLTYRELEARAGQLACHLRSLGVGPDAFSAIYMARSLDVIVALLGVLKAGGAYVPLDPRLPSDRLKILLSDMHPRAVLTSSTLRHELPPHDASVVCLDAEDWPHVSTDHTHHSIASTFPPTRGADLAYVLFTSGSTGRPKAVAVEHRNLINYVDSIAEALDLPSGASYACVSTFAADLGNTAIFPALCSGGTLHVISDNRATDADAFADYFSQHSIDCLKIVPSHLQALLSARRPERALPKRRLILGGEAAGWNLVKTVHELAPDCLVFNHYGPTETTVGTSTYRVCANGFDARTASVPIGRPITNARMYVLDSELEPVPIWTPGEIYIGGAGVARGYLNQPDATAEKFVPSPFEAGGRLYRTGDIGRHLSDGSVEFIGRTDHQIKIRGFRVELGEIESILNQCSGVKQATALAREDLHGEKEIAAYVVADDPRTLRPEALRDALKSKLPEHMVPSAFFVLEALPLTPNGKVDRAQLLRLRHEAARDETVSQRPATPLESALLRIFAEVLRIQTVGVDSNFFDLGGHSLLAVQVLSRIRRDLNVDLPVRVLFEKPTVAGIATAIVATSRAAPASELTFEDGHAQSEAEGTSRIPRRTTEGPVPLSSTQKQMWFIDQLSPGSASYNMAYAFRLRGALDLQALGRSFDEIVRRHESLRSIFTSIDGVPMQVVVAPPTPILSVSKHPVEPGVAASEPAVQLASEHARTPFELAQGPLLRCRVFEVTDEEHVLLIAVHHIVSDGWSWSVLFAELSTLYEAFSNNRRAHLPELPLQYGDFALWESERLRTDVLDQRLAYWTRQLTNAPTVIDLPTDRPRGAVQSFRGTVHTETFPLDVKEQVDALGREEGATLFMTLCAAFNALLFRWTGQEDIVVGSTIAGRNRPELEPLVGLFISTLVLRTDLSGDPTFRELLRRVREVALGAYANQEVPFAKLIEQLHSKRSLSHGSLFQVMFVLHQGTSQQDLSLAGVTVERVPLELGAVKFDLSVSMVDKPDGLICSVGYQTDLFDASTIRRLVAQFQRLLSGVVQNPDIPLSRLPLMSEVERDEMLVTWNDTRKDYPTETCIHELFEQQVDRSPDACAVVSGETALSYGELNTKAAEVADRLREAGVRPGACVVICIDRSLDMLIGLFGVLKAGCTYVPLDSQYSLERLTSVLEDTGAPVLVTGRGPAHTLAAIRERFGHLVVICLDEPGAARNRSALTRSTVPVSPDDLAYVIYTSGSTGTPKGVEITHRSLANFALASAESFALRPADRVLQFASFSFDTAAEEIFPCLITGATLVLRNDQMLYSASAFLSQCRQWQITVLDLPTVYWHELTENIAAGNLELPEALRLVILGGDRALPERAEQWLRASRGRRIRLLNEYGPTEATVVATTHEITDAVSVGASGQVPIGRPIANVQTYILDRSLNPVVIGARGELFIGGAGLARGYRHRPDSTAESFVPNPFSDVPGARLYKTGDLARYRPDGSIEFLGRTDHQVKVRGFRVEPGEIEAVLTEHAGIRHAVVMARQDHAGDHRLIAYVVPASGARLQSHVVRDFLKRRVPPYMVPSAFVFLDAFPLTTHGKVDRRALPEPGLDDSELPNTFVAARTPLERELVQEWERVLSTRPIGIRDNFFEIGGDSLLAVRMIARIEKRLGRAASVATLFESPTIEQLAVRLEQRTASGSSSSLIAVQPHGSRLPLFWVHGDQSFAILPAYLGQGQPLYGLEHQSQDGQPARYTRVEDIAGHYLREVRSAHPRGPYLLGGYSFGAVVAFEMAQQLRKAGEPVELLFLLDPPGKEPVEHPASAKDAVHRHLQQLRWRNASKWPHYVWSRIRDRVHQHVGSKLVRYMNRVRVRLCLSRQRPLPPSLRSQYILAVYAQALREYVPQRYSGPATLVKADAASYKPRFDWVSLIVGGPRVLRLTSGHMDLRIDPQVRQWAAWLKESLDRRYTA
jgi:amino acid adenylation domain-containing protein